MNTKPLLWAAAILLALAPEFFVDRHPSFTIEKLWGFYGCLSIMATAIFISFCRLLFVLVGRSDKARHHDDETSCPH